ncbi:S24/S26 family peptidase [Bifidobacterium parmae]|uniref:S24/S26 family peptidase n=1 Tax=Bifidobacterium parmae TaxID=361854 RepID=UPI001A9C7C4D|nr:S24/S26 family peptidase [Bifidobacterium parmae]
MKDADDADGDAAGAGGTGADSGVVATDIEGVLAREGMLVSTTVGVSMLPMLRNRRDTIVIRPLAPGERLRVGDVPLYRVGERYVLHRVIGVHDGWYAIRGDNCVATEHVRDGQVLGRLTECYRGSRHVVCDESRGYRLYWRMWLATWPLRRCWKAMRHAVGRVLRLFGWKGLRRGPL